MIGQGSPQGDRRARWMMFVDGENFSMRGRDSLHLLGLEPKSGRFFERDVFLWIHRVEPRQLFPPLHQARLENFALRWHYYSAVQGDSARLDDVRDRLLARGFDPHVFKKIAGTKSKGVDITLARDFLGHAHKDTYDAAVLVAGDGDYVPLVEEVKRLGKQVFVLFFEKEGLGLSAELRRSADRFFPFDDLFGEFWKEMRETETVPWVPPQRKYEDELQTLEAGLRLLGEEFQADADQTLLVRAEHLRSVRAPSASAKAVSRDELLIMVKAFEAAGRLGAPEISDRAKEFFGRLVTRLGNSSEGAGGE